jgi:hypothetical protein
LRIEKEHILANQPIRLPGVRIQNKAAWNTNCRLA